MNEFHKSIDEILKQVDPTLECFLTVGFQDRDIYNHVFSQSELTPTILSKFPASYQAPETFSQFCFPCNVFIDKDKSEATSEQFNFILTNDKGRRMYCSCLLIYERVKESDLLQDDCNPIRSSLMRAESDQRHKNTELLHNEEFFTDFALPELSNRFRSQSSKTFKYHRKNSQSQPSSPKMNEQNFDFYSGNGYLVPKCLVLISPYAFLETHKKILHDIYKLSMQPLELPIECYIAHFFLEVPTPPRGQTEVLYQLLDKNYVFSMPSCNKLPLCDTNMGLLFSSLDLNNLISVFASLIKETKTIFVSKFTDKLTACSYSLLSLLYPLHWNLIYVPVLPENLIDYVYSPVNYVYGVHSNYRDDAYLRCQGNILIVDLDNNSLEFKFESDRPKSSKRGSLVGTIPVLPDHYGKKLQKRLLKVLEKLKHFDTKKLILNTADLDQFTIDKIRKLFLWFFVCILKKYKKYMNFETYVSDDPSSFFDQDGFLVEFPENGRNFMRKLFKTQMFANFCENKLNPGSIEQHWENLFFDESVAAKINRSKLTISKLPTPFISDKSQEIRSSYVVHRPEICWTERKNYVYHTFPDFDYSILIEYGLPVKSVPRLSELHENLRLPVVKRPQNLSEKEILFLIWVDIWCACLWAQNKHEILEQIDDVILVLENMKNEGIRPTNSLYKKILEACADVNPSLALPFYSYMNSNEILIDGEIVLILQKIISKLYSSSQNIRIRTTRSTIEFINNSIQKSENLKMNRVFTHELDIFANQILRFIISETCPGCKQTLGQKQIIKGWSSNSSNIKTRCSICKATFTAKLRIRIGLDFGFNLPNSSTKDEEVDFVSIYYLSELVKDLLEVGGNKKILDINFMRSDNQVIFWNLIWHFNNSQLPFQYFVPYDKEETKGAEFEIKELNESWSEDLENETFSNREIQTDLSWNEFDKLVNVIKSS